MRSKQNNVLLIMLAVLSLTLVMVSGIYLMLDSRNELNKKEEAKKADVMSDEVVFAIRKIKEENASLELVYESTKIKEVLSLIYKLEDGYKNIIIDTFTGNIRTFDDLLKEDKIDEFLETENKLLNEKYPEFIVDGIKSSGGEKFYYLKDNEVIIYYYNFSFKYPYTGTISLRINYNEIKNCLKFTPVLDSNYQNENGYQYNGDSNKKVVALTFDDGPSGTYNPLILDVLAKNKARATFFMVGRMMNSCQKCVLDTYNSGNEVASHTYEHMNIKKSDVATVNESLEKVNNLYHDITGDTIKYLRPPYGAYNSTNLENATVPYILWDLDTEDWRYRNVDHIVNYIMDNVQDGSIILMHELYETSYEALKIVLPRLYAEGYKVVTISELAEAKGKTLEVGKAYRALH